jgi:iron complex outermembrane recepter protein
MQSNSIINGQQMNSKRIGEDMRVFFAAASAATLAICIATPCHAQADNGPIDSESEPEIIVTGVLTATSIEKAPIAITALSGEALSQQAPVSTADILKAVPGVFVNSAIGEIRNIVFSRGVSANSLEAASGYFYVSLQEDGLPVEPILSENYGPDYFTRADIMLSRVEALRGGTAAITGPNAPGGIFNYISKNGKSSPGQEIRAKFGLEADGKNPYRRIDLYSGGALSDGGLYYAIGGFYRKSDGQRDAGYALNKGGQIRGNLLYDYDTGSVQFGMKYLDDSNAFYEFMPAFNFNNPRLAAPYTNTSSVLPPAGNAPYTDPLGRRKTWNPDNLVQTKAFSVNVDWRQDINDNLKIQNKWSWSRNRTDWNTGAVVSATRLTDIATLNTIGVISAAAPAGTLTFRNNAGATVASAFVNLANLATGNAVTVLSNNLPNQSILANGVQTVLGFAPEYEGQGWQNQLTLSGDYGAFDFAAGAYYQNNTLDVRTDSAGFGVLTLEPQPQFLNITYTPVFPANVAGQTFQVTGPGGLSNHGVFGGADGYNGRQRQYSLFFSAGYDLNDKIRAEGAVRYENLRYAATNITVLPATGNPFTSGGFDGNPLTLFDNRIQTIGTPTSVRRKFDFFNYSGSISYAVSDQFQTYVRYSNSRKAPDFNIIRSIDEPAEIATQFPREQRIQQLEMGLKYFGDTIQIQAFPFYSKLSNVAALQTFTDDTNQLYSPPPTFGQIKTYGIELQASADISAQLKLDASLTVQDAKSSKFGNWTVNTPVRSDDVLVTVPNGKADNNPNIIARGTATYRPVEALSLFATVSYLGKRPANRFNAFNLPGFATVDLGIAYDVTKNFSLQANVTNVFDNYGILSYSRSGSLLASLDRQSLTSAQVQATGNTGLLQVIPSAPRAFYLTASAKF